MLWAIQYNKSSLKHPCSVVSTLQISFCPCRSTRQQPHPGPAHRDTPPPGAQATSNTSSTSWPPQNHWKAGSLRTQYLRRELWLGCDAPRRDVCLQGKFLTSATELLASFYLSYERKTLEDISLPSRWFITCPCLEMQSASSRAAVLTS